MRVVTLMPAEKIRILIVDDDLDARHSLGVFLSLAGMNVALAASTAEARKILPSFQPRVVISDLAMPEEDGFALIEKIRQAEERSGGHLPVIAMTGLADPTVRQRALQAGFDKYFVKPINPAAILSSVRQVAASA